MYDPNTLEYRYNKVQYNMILYTWLQRLGQNMNVSINPQKTPHNSPWRVSYGMSFVMILEKIDRVITAPRCSSTLMKITIWWRGDSDVHSILIMRNQSAAILIIPHVHIYMSYMYSKIHPDSSPRSVAYMRRWIGSTLVRMVACRLFGAKPLSKPMLGYC